jgi:hypothetical protein
MTGMSSRFCLLRFDADQISNGISATMSEVPANLRPRLRAVTRPDIIIDGKIWRPRQRIAEEDIHVSDKSAKRYNFRTVYIGGVAYCPVEESLRDIAARARRRNEPPSRRRR